MATRRQVLTAAAHQILLENPEMYRNIANMQDLRREQARRWAQRIVGLNDPGPGAVEQAYMKSDSMNKMLPELLDTKAKILKPIQDAAIEALKSKVGMDDALARILIANINAEGQTKANYLGALSEISTTALKNAVDLLEKQTTFTQNALGLAAPKNEEGVKKVNDLYTTVTAQTAAGGTSPTTEMTRALETAAPEELAGLLNKAAETKDPAVYARVEGAIKQAGKLDSLLGHVAKVTAADQTASAQYAALGLDMRVAGTEGESQVDRMQKALKSGLVGTNPARGAALRRTLEAMGDERLKGQLDDAIAQKVTPEVRDALDQVDAAIAEASASKDLVAPSEVREQMRTSEGYVEKAEEYLKQAGIEDSGKLIGLGAAARRAAKQQRRGFVKDIEGEGPEAKVETRRLSLNKKEALDRKNVAGGWSETKGAPPSMPTSESSGGAATAAKRPKKETVADEGAGTERFAATDRAPEAEAFLPVEDESLVTAQRQALQAAVSARRNLGVLENLRALRNRERAEEAPSPVENVADSGPPARPVGYYRRSTLA
jgi:hypothetical protein